MAALSPAARRITGPVAAGGILYTTGALIYAYKRPDPVPAIFGYHEVIHVLVIAAAALQYAATAFLCFPRRDRDCDRAAGRAWRVSEAARRR